MGYMKMTLKTIEKINELVKERKGLEEFLCLEESSKLVQIKYTKRYFCYYSDHSIELSQSGKKSLVQFIKARIEEIDKELKELGVEEE